MIARTLEGGPAAAPARSGGMILPRVTPRFRTMNYLRPLVPVLLVLLLGCSSAGDSEPQSILSMHYPIFSATSPETMVRID